jgi:nitroreductase
MPRFYDADASSSRQGQFIQSKLHNPSNMNEYLSGESILQQLKWRYAVKKFDASRSISIEEWSVLAKSLVLTPSSFGLQPWRFYVVSDPETKSKLPAISWGQSQVSDASHVVVMALRENLSETDIDRYIERICEVRGGQPESLIGFKKMMIGSLIGSEIGFDVNHWAANQVYIALGQFMAVAAIMGIDTCPMEGILREKYDELLGIKRDGYSTCVVCVAGYRAGDDRYAAIPKVRFADEHVIIPRRATQ